MHHMFDETPTQAMTEDFLSTTNNSNAIYDTHLAKIGETVEAKAQVDTSQYRYRYLASSVYLAILSIYVYTHAERLIKFVSLSCNHHHSIGNEAIRWDL